MANNLFISYDLMAPGQHYERVMREIESLGAWAKIEYSLYYVNCSLSTDEAARRVWAVMTPNDKLIVINATANQFSGFNIDPDVLRQMQIHWYI